MKKDEEEKQSTYMALGMCFGMMVGTIGMVFFACFGNILWGIPCVGIGLLLGMIIGMLIPKAKK